MTDTDRPSSSLFVNSFSKMSKKDRNGKKHFDKQQQIKFKKIELLPINYSTKQILMRMIKKPSGVHQVTDIVRVLKADKKSVTIQAKIFTQENTVEDVVVKILKESNKKNCDLNMWCRGEDGKVKSESLELFHHENIVIMKMLKNAKTLEQMLDKSNNIQEIFEEIIGLIRDSKDICWDFWKTNLGSCLKKIVHHDGKWKILTLHFEREHYDKKDFMSMNLAEVIEVFSFYGMNKYEMEKIFMKTIRERYDSHLSYCYSSKVFKFVHEKYFLERCNDFKQYVFY